MCQLEALFSTGTLAEQKERKWQAAAAGAPGSRCRGGRDPPLMPPFPWLCGHHNEKGRPCRHW